MRIVFLIFVAVLLFVIFMMIVKMIKDKNMYDRMNGLSVIGADVLILIILFGFLDGRIEMYIDIAIAYGILGMVTNILVAKYLGGKKK
ncbi:monovalent cation/H+ antiporter complex subunit F [Eubacterium oxidoreducens]|uniref:Multicomponent Na+:H+ antiporter subunit F n=1 Tax=Eubacterium oxidoreducens TaxID=1732 RepID=A0A1G6BSI7_EUBOX|nr:monovalent cation/H+ antiporter complex subunit F [Eubacterium oxidoreducens]SDB23497.1 multicomponent Na+:H+ antiporter subunit F [Eubacterium oxidoreducens]